MDLRQRPCFILTHHPAAECNITRFTLHSDGEVAWCSQWGDTSLSTPILLAAARTIRNACVRLSGPPVLETNTGGVVTGLVADGGQSVRRPRRYRHYSTD